MLEQQPDIIPAIAFGSLASDRARIVVMEPIEASELPGDGRMRLQAAADARVTARINVVFNTTFPRELP